MGSDDEYGRDTATIRAWLEKRATYAEDRDVPLPPLPEGLTRPSPAAPEPEPAPTTEASSANPPGRRMSARPSRLPSSNDAGKAVVDMLGPIEVPAPEIPAAEIPTATTETERADEVRADETERDVVLPTAPRRLFDAGPRPTGTAVPAPISHGGWMEAEPEDLPPAVIEFKPRTSVRRALGMIMLGSLLATAAAAVFATQETTTGTLAVTATLALLFLVVWAVRASTTPTQLTIRRSKLEVTRSGRRTIVELASPYTPVAVVGEPDGRGWQVLIEQLDAPVIVLTKADVDPASFMRVLLRLRPDLRPGDLASS